MDSTGYHCSPPGPGPLLLLHATVSGAVAAAVGGGRRRSARQEQSACRRLWENYSHEASGQACCQSARAICTPERVDNLLAGACGHALAETRTRSARRQADDRIQWGTIRRASRIPSSFGYGKMIFGYAQARKREQYKIASSKCCPAACTSCRLGFLAPEIKRRSQLSPVQFERNNVLVELSPFLMKNVRVKSSPFRIKNVLFKSSPFQMKNVLVKSSSEE
jgi:hypothetical protein